MMRGMAPSANMMRDITPPTNMVRSMAPPTNMVGGMVPATNIVGGMVPATNMVGGVPPPIGIMGDMVSLAATSKMAVHGASVDTLGQATNCSASRADPFGFVPSDSTFNNTSSGDFLQIGENCSSSLNKVDLESLWLSQPSGITD